MDAGQDCCRMLLVMSHGSDGFLGCGSKDDTPGTLIFALYPLECLICALLSPVCQTQAMFSGFATIWAV